MPADLPPQYAPQSASLGSLGAAPSAPPQAVRVFRIAPSPDFSLMASPLAWDVFEVEPGVFEVLPTLQTLRYTPGQKGVAQVKDPHTGHWVGNPGRALANLQQRGLIEVPRSWMVDLFNADGDPIGQRQGYTHKIQGHQGAVHLDVFTRPYALGDQTFFERDRKGWFIFLRRVRDELLGGAPDPNVARSLQLKLENMARVAGEKAHRSPSASRVCDQIKEKLGAFESKKKGKK
jgi:hypothetical protein